MEVNILELEKKKITNVEPFFFKTKNSYYVYDDATQIIIPITIEEKIFLENYFSIKNFKNEDTTKCKNLLKKITEYNLFKRVERKDTFLNLNKSLKNIVECEGIRSLILTVNDSCNMRCKYCYFSTKYKYTPNYSTNSMSWDIMKESVDYYININRRAMASNPNIKFSIGFYGGEPLLNWENIKRTVEYCKKQYTDIYNEMVFPITTNGLLLDDKKINYMLENRFFISVSFDGNETEHDRNRVDVDGKGTFKKVFNTLKLLEKLYKEKEDNKNVLPYNILITYDNKTDLIQLNNFFKKYQWLDQRILHINKVSTLNTTYYENQSDYNTRMTVYAMQEKLINLYKNIENRTKFIKIYVEQMLSFVSNIGNYTVNPLKGSCIPGQQRLHIDTEGRFHICEKMNRMYPIGSLKDGLNILAQKNIIDKYIRCIEDTCENCNVSNLCSFCYSVLQNDGKDFSINTNDCDEIKIYIKRMLSYYYGLLENNIKI